MLNEFKHYFKNGYLIWRFRSVLEHIGNAKIIELFIVVIS